MPAHHKAPPRPWTCCLSGGHLPPCRTRHPSPARHPSSSRLCRRPRPAIWRRSAILPRPGPRSRYSTPQALHLCPQALPAVGRGLDFSPAGLPAPPPPAHAIPHPLAHARSHPHLARFHPPTALETQPEAGRNTPAPVCATLYAALPDTGLLPEPLGSASCRPKTLLLGTATQMSWQCPTSPPACWSGVARTPKSPHSWTVHATCLPAWVLRVRHPPWHGTGWEPQPIGLLELQS